MHSFQLKGRSNISVRSVIQVNNSVPICTGNCKMSRDKVFIIGGSKSLSIIRNFNTEYIEKAAKNSTESKIWDSD